MPSPLSVARVLFARDRTPVYDATFLTPLLLTSLPQTAQELQQYDQHLTIQFKASRNTDTELAWQLSAKENGSRGEERDARFANPDLRGIQRRISSIPFHSQSDTTKGQKNPISLSTQQVGSVSPDAATRIESHSPRQRPISAETTPRSDMGYNNTIQSNNRSPQNTSIKMERTPSLHSSTSSGPKETDDNLSVDSAGVMGNASGDGAVMSPQSPQSPVGTRHTDGTEALSSSVFGTPSTISTAPSTEADEGSTADDAADSAWLDRATWRLDDDNAASLTPILLPRNPAFQSIPANDGAQHGITGMPSQEAAAVAGEQQLYHRRSRSWDQQQQIRHHGQIRSWEGSPVASPYSSPSRGHAAQPGTWEQMGAPQSRVASFRNNVGHQTPRGYSNVAAHPDAWHQVRSRTGEPRHPQHGHHMHFESRPGPSGYQQAHGNFQAPRQTPSYGPHHSGTHTPPRSKQQRSPLHTPQRSPTAPSTPGGSPSTSGANPPRSSSEVLKTLLRKKACLYEPDTSRAIAFVTWLVGRELALEYGYFSRQQLQSGVHAAVAKKIESGTITRTKVNRCMQIILNSCFHYIIPRPDGSEENGEAFRDSFAAVAVDDSSEIENLPLPWDNLTIDKEFVLMAASRDSTPANSPRLGSQQSKAADDGQSKRAVLLCFNENVRSFEDVLRCHNEFIRDTANAAHLQLSDKEWRSFFGRDSSKTATAWRSTSTSTAVTKAEGRLSPPDVLGRMNTEQLSRFRTTWCAKRYEHDHDQCAFAHVEVNGGWLRRNPSDFEYRAEICPSVVRVMNKSIGPFGFTMNQCEKGESCDFAHSREEVSYHPDRYKRKMCTSLAAKGMMCPLGDICPDFHSEQHAPRGKRRASPDRRNHRSSNYRGSHGHGTATGKGVPNLMPEGSPMVYVNPAPISNFEKNLGPPGLQSLFRRHSSVVAGYVQYGERCKCCYSNFGDDAEIGLATEQDMIISSSRGLPSSPPRGGS